MEESKEGEIVVLHIGSNDLNTSKKVNRVELLKKYKNMIIKIKERNARVVCSGVLPGYKSNYKFLNDAFNFNINLKYMCKDLNVGYFNAWDSFYDKPEMYKKDNLHLNELGDIRLGRMLNSYTKNFFRD